MNLCEVVSDFLLNKKVLLHRVFSSGVHRVS